MRLVYKFQYKPNKTNSIILSSMTYASARLYNVGNYERVEYKKLGFENMPNWYDQKKRLKDNEWFKSLPSQTSQDVLQRLDEGWKSYFKLLKTKGINNPKPPFYKRKGGHFNIKYLNNSFKVIDNKIRFMVSKREKEFLKENYNINIEFFYIRINKKLDNIKQIEFAYKNDSLYEVYIVYEVSDTIELINNNKAISIDLGVCNLASIYDNNGKSFIISGSTYQNTLYYYNKKIAHYKSILDLEYPDLKNTSKRINKLYEKKKRVISYIIHKSTKMIVDYCIENDITTVIIGDITNIRDNNDKGSLFNQKLHSLPFYDFYNKLEYKLKRMGIKLQYQKESYSSSCSPLSKEVSKEYQEKNRIKRGLYKKDNIIYNADSLGAYNIMRLYNQEKNCNIPMILNGLSNQTKTSICVTN